MCKEILHSKRDRQHSGTETELLRENVWVFFLDSYYKYLKSINAKAQKHKGGHAMGLLK